MSHALLLRLAQSQHWSLHSALHYLATYPDHIGITHYITQRLQQFSAAELRDVWGFICHLLVTRPSSSAALETYILEQASESSHLAIMTTWFMQAHLKDLATKDRGTKAFIVCERVLQRCHDIVYGDALLQSQISSARKDRHGIKLPGHLNAGLVGMGIVLAGALGMPKLTELMGDVAIKQGHYGDGGERVSRWGSEHGVEQPFSSSPDAEPPDVESPANMTAVIANAENEDDDGDDDVTTALDCRKHNNLPLVSQSNTGNKTDSYQPHLPSSSVEQSSSSKAANLTSSSFPYARASLASRSVDLRGNKQVIPAHLSTPSLPLEHPQFTQSEGPSQVLDAKIQVVLLKQHYLQTQIAFTLRLEDISDKLVLIPKPARVSALRAQLTALNHQLPTEACIPLWCNTTDVSIGVDSPAVPHHRVVRIPASECVVLNSAERAPYLLLVEYLEHDLSFDPTKRANKGIIDHLSEHQFPRSAPLPIVSVPRTSGLHRTAVSRAGHLSVPDSPIIPANQGEGAPSTSLQDETTPTEEIDVVEQVFGIERMKMIDDLEYFDETTPLALKNKELEKAAWTQSHGQTDLPLAHKMQPKREVSSNLETTSHSSNLRTLTLEDYADRMSTAAAMLAQLNAALHYDGSPSMVHGAPPIGGGGSWLPPLWKSPNPTNNGDAKTDGATSALSSQTPVPPKGHRLQRADAEAIRDRIMREMDALEDERMRRMRTGQNDMSVNAGHADVVGRGGRDEDIIRRELRRDDPSAAIFSERWQEKKDRIRSASPYGHLANWNCASVIVKTGADLRQEQLAVQLIREFAQIFKEEHCRCYVRPYQVVITGATSGLIETVTDAVSIHSIKKAMYARRLPTTMGLQQVTLMDHFIAAYGEHHTAKFIKAQHNFAQSLAGYSLVTYFLQIKDRHNGNILLDRDGRLVHIDFGFMLSNSPGNLGFEAAPFKLPLEYIEVLGGIDGDSFKEFQHQFRVGFEAARKHSQRIITLVELMQKESTMPCFTAFGDQTSVMLRDRFQLQSSSVGEHVERLILSSIGSAWTRLYDSYQYYSQSIF